MCWLRAGIRLTPGLLTSPHDILVKYTITVLTIRSRSLVGGYGCYPQVGEKIPAERLYDCITVILSYQNADGGMATYENTRSFHWLEVGAVTVAC